MAKKNNSYKLDLANQTLTLNAAFAEAANDPTSDEYELVRQFLTDFPNLKVVRRTHDKPVRYKNSDGSITSRNKHNGLTYEKMEKFILAISPKDDTDYLEAFYNVRDIAEASCASPYSVVSKWFMAQFPKFRTNPIFYMDNLPEIIDFSAILEKAKPQKRSSKIEADNDEKGA